MIHVLFIAFLIIILLLMYKNDNNLINSVVNKFGKETFETKHKNNIHNPYKSQPLTLKKTEENNLLNEKTTGMERSKFKNVDEMEYLGEIESRPASYLKVSINEPEEDVIIEQNDSNIRGLMNMKQFYE
jgi:hypothetical protein